MTTAVGVRCLSEFAAVGSIFAIEKGPAAVASGFGRGKSGQALIPRSDFFGDVASSSVSCSGRSSSSSIPRRRGSPLYAIADQATREVDEGQRKKGEDPFTDVAPAAEKVPYNWQEQWYPLYMTSEIPKDGPLALTVYDRNLVVFYDGDGKLNCLEDRCPHRAAKLSEGQLMDGRLECLYHGWQFEGDGTCAKIPQLAPGAKIPKRACARSYAVKDSQGILWVWMADARTAPYEKVPYYEHYDKPGWGDYSTIHELPYDYSILVENVLDPAHIPISHDRTDSGAKRELAQAMVFDLKERTDLGFAGNWYNISTPETVNFTRFHAPSMVYNEVKRTGRDGIESHFSATVLTRPTGQGKCMLILRFGFSRSDGKPFTAITRIPKWIIHSTGTTILEQDMGFLSAQNETMVRENKPTKDFYLNLKSQDVWVDEYRKWMDKVGHGMPYYFGHRTLSPPPISALQEHSPAGLTATISSTYPSKGAFGHKYARDPTNRYFRHVVHCKPCRTALSNFEKAQKASLVLGLLSAGVATIMSKPVYRTAFVIVGFLMSLAYYLCGLGIKRITENYVRPHRNRL
ncbi:hypothetical protein R1sor_017072 [Riccia sorocarpa]|uniref:Rieske domain-containing protein n=1 Tax=Riccia sorocarpa TaxID=122646 RepID=A0ABD3I9H8_9MARC